MKSKISHFQHQVSTDCLGMCTGTLLIPLLDGTAAASEGDEVLDQTGILLDEGEKEEWVGKSNTRGEK